MIGEKYHATGVVITPRGDGEWGARVDFYDAGFCDVDSTEGVLKARYIVSDLERAVRTLIDDAKKLGIEFRDPVANRGINLYMEGDGEWDSIEYPDNWRGILSDIAKRIPGTVSIYDWLDGKTD